MQKFISQTEYKTAKPILFNMDMVRAILDDQKTETRRVVKPQPPATSHVLSTNEKWFWAFWEDGEQHPMHCPYRPGDVLYVRETWNVSPGILGDPSGPIYMADYSRSELAEFKSRHFRWHPSIHMPKEYARLFLRVTNIRVERLQDITENQAEREGCYRGPLLDGSELMVEARPSFASLWDRTIEKPDLDSFGWSANPWVWVIEFERVNYPKGEKHDAN